MSKVSDSNLLIIIIWESFSFSQGVVKIFYDARNRKFAEFSKGVVDGRPFEGVVIMDFETVCIISIEEILILLYTGDIHPHFFFAPFALLVSGRI